MLEATIARVVAPWKAEREAWARRETLIADAVQWRLPWLGMSDADKVRAASAARAALSEVPLSASETEVRAAVDSGVGEIRREIENRVMAEQAQAQAERQRKQLETAKHFLISFGVSNVARHLTRLQAAGEIWDEDLVRRPELERMIRDQLAQQLRGDESIEVVQRLVVETVNQSLD